MKDDDLFSYGTSTEPPKIANRSWKAYSTLIGGFIYMIFPGSTYITGNIAPFIAAYFGFPSRTHLICFLPGWSSTRFSFQLALILLVRGKSEDHDLYWRRGLCRFDVHSFLYD